MIASLPLTPGHLADIKPARVLTITPFYPSVENPVSGCFVAEPLAEAEVFGIQNTVIAAQPFYRSRIHVQLADTHASWLRYPSLPGSVGLPSAGTFLSARVTSLFRRMHVQQQFDIIHAHGPLPCGHAAYNISRSRGIGYVVTVHGLDAFSRRQVSGYSSRRAEALSRIIYEGAERVICVSEAVRREVMAGAPQASTTVIYNGADPRIFYPNDADACGSTLLSVGNLIPSKGHELVLDAFSRIHAEFPDLTWEIIGEGPGRDRLQSFARGYGLESKIHFLGRQNRSQVAEAMRRCTVFVLPSRYEALGCVYLEAMASGKAAIACYGQGIEEIIADGVNGLLIYPDDVHGLTSSLRKLLGDPRLRLRLGQAARETIVRRFTVSHQAEQMAALYRKCVR